MTLASILPGLSTWISILNLIYLRKPGVYSGDCHGWAVHRNGGMQNQPRYFYRLLGFCHYHTTVPCSGGVAEYQSRAQFLAVSAVRFSAAVGFAGDGALRRHPRTPLLWYDVPHLFAVHAVR